MGERFLTEEVLALPHGIQAHSGVHVIGNSDGHGVYLVAHFGQHLAIILKNGSVGGLVLRPLCAAQVDVTKAYVLCFWVTCHGTEIRPSTAFGANGCELQFRVQVATTHECGSCSKGRKSGCGLKEISAIHGLCLF
jgi:hypothetical protein